MFIYIYIYIYKHIYIYIYIDVYIYIDRDREREREREREKDRWIERYVYKNVYIMYALNPDSLPKSTRAILRRAYSTPEAGVSRIEDGRIRYFRRAHQIFEAGLQRI